MSALLLSSYRSPIGLLNLISDGHVLLALNLSTVAALKESLPQEDALREIIKINRIPVVTDLLESYFDGEIEAINAISVRQPGATFSQAAWKAMRKVKGGKTLSYADLAKRAGSAAAVRAAGSACAKNAIAIVVPCHRIVKSGGGLGNYAYGLEKKNWLLHHEGYLL